MLVKTKAGELFVFGEVWDLNLLGYLCCSAGLQALTEMHVHPYGRRNCLFSLDCLRQANNEALRPLPLPFNMGLACSGV